MKKNAIGSSIRALRTQRGITQAALGEVLGVSMQAISKWERGGAPDVDIIPTLADYFGVSIDFLFGRKTLQGDDLDLKLYHCLSETTGPAKYEQACQHFWSMFKGISDLKGLEDYDYTTADGSEQATRSKLVSDEGIAWMASTKNFHLGCIAPEPKEGFDQMLGRKEDYLRLFSMLSDEDCFTILVYLYTLPPTLISAEYVAQSTEVPLEKTRAILEALVKEGFVTQNAAAVDCKKIQMFYKPEHKVAFVFFLYFAAEAVTTHRLWHLSNVIRTKPYYKNPFESE